MFLQGGDGQVGGILPPLLEALAGQRAVLPNQPPTHPGQGRYEDERRGKEHHQQARTRPERGFSSFLRHLGEL